MNQLEFQTAISPILMRWPRAYSGDQVQLVQEEVKMLSHPDFVRMVRHILGSSRVAPMVPDFRKAMTELSIRPVFKVFTNSNAQSEIRTVENYLYFIKENIWSDNDYIFIRGERPSFIIKRDAPENPLVLESMSVKSQKILEIKSHLTANTYSKFMDSLTRKETGSHRLFSQVTI